MRARIIKHTYLEITKGVLAEKEATMAELLRGVHQHNKYNVVEDKASGALKIRDLRQIFSDFSGSQASLEVRRNCILINLPPIRAIILHDTVLIFPLAGGEALSAQEVLHRRQSVLTLDISFETLLPEAAGREDAHSVWRLASLWPLLSDVTVAPVKERDGREGREEAERKRASKIRDCIDNVLQVSKQKHGGLLSIPFEFAVLEAILAEVVAFLQGDFKPIKTAVDYACSELGRSQESFASTRTVEGVNRLKTCLTALSFRVKGIKTAISELLDNDEDMSRLEISRFYEASRGRKDTQRGWDYFLTHACAETERASSAGVSEGQSGEGGVGGEGEEYSLEDVELLLECYIQEVQLLEGNIAHLQETLDDVLQLMNLNLATVRNKVLKVEVGLNVVSVLVGFGACIGGLFGMNLRSELEDSISMFYGVMGATIGVCVITAVAVGVFLKRALTL
ncbi:unnamed protein product [Vitrella brassicaformis CCMP3155]|uniref:Magnesium transporter n=1 Tax=Vitrella brassicaformis (strain CCMP3155) TaxID=1169540 RepID=A0A0G4GGE2_VITBC|nr:unnamed protein product [Vitrella brassicaformis CCMP3155]|eukprot:CEM28683.1 unnamed protein product [Vitrella brassicaformis CCMP3155]